MSTQTVQEARGLVNLALVGLESEGNTHPGALGHLKAAKTQLDAACSLLALEPTVPPS